MRAAWAEAEIFVHNKLRQGCHPEVLDREIESEMRIGTNSDYKFLFLRYARRILTNLRRSSQLGGLPTLAEYEKIYVVRSQRRGFEVMMYKRFTVDGLISRYGMDDEIAREIGESSYSSHMPSLIFNR